MINMNETNLTPMPGIFYISLLLFDRKRIGCDGCSAYRARVDVSTITEAIIGIYCVISTLERWR